jgi:DNA repair exonuclease SbcCD ATPase subunit
MERPSPQQRARLATDYEHAVRTVAAERQRLKAARRERDNVAQAQRLLQKVAQVVQREAHRKIASVVTKCLQAVFGAEAYEFRIHFERKRGRTQARMAFVREGVEMDPLTAAGGGVVDVAAFGLRVSLIVLCQPGVRRLIVADEPFRFVSAEYRPRVREMIETLAEELDLQFILVTHSPEFQMGKVVTL